MKILHSKILGEGIPLFILHGFLGMGDNWMSLGRRFAEDFSVHLIDLRNHGRSFHADEMNYRVISDDIRRYARHYGIDRYILLGHSMGGKAAMYLAVHFPEEVIKLIVADIAPKPYPDRHGKILKALESVDFSLFTTREQIDNHLAGYIDSPAIRGFLMKNLKRKKEGGFAYKFNLPVLSARYEELNETLPQGSVFNGDTLFLKGAGSPYISPPDEVLIKMYFPRAILRIIPDAGHWLHAEQPDIFYRMVMDFIN